MCCWFFWSQRRDSNPRQPVYKTGTLPLSYAGVLWSGMQDSNLRPLAPKASALPDCANPRGAQGRIRTFTPKHSTLNATCLPVSPLGHKFGAAGGTRTHNPLRATDFLHTTSFDAFLVCALDFLFTLVFTLGWEP